MTYITEVIKQAEAEVREAEAASAAADSRAAAAQVDALAAREHLQNVRTVLEWLHRHDQPQPVTSSGGHAEQPQTEPPTRFGKPVREVAQTELCLGALEGLGGTATNKQIRDRLVRDGHDMDLNKVRSTLKYLGRKKPPLVHSDPGSGLWRLVQSAPFVPAGTPLMNGAGREP